MKRAFFLVSFLMVCLALIPSCDPGGGVTVSEERPLNDTLSSEDSSHTIDTVILRDSTFFIDTVITFDTVFSKDTIYWIDTTVNFDTVLRYDSIFIFDTIRAYDTTHSYDTSHSYDTVHHYDTVTIKDTVILKENDWADMAEIIAPSSYAIGFRDEGNGKFVLLGSGFAVSPHKIATNAHVARGLLAEYIYKKQKGHDVINVAIKNGSSCYGSGVFELDTFFHHSGYNDSGFCPDVAYFTIKEKIADTVPLANIDTLHQLKSGQRIGTLGFPGKTSEIISRNVVATFKDGTISALRTMGTNETPGIHTNKIIQHNFNTMGGNSGSPIFNANGKLIAIHSEGAYNWTWNDITKSMVLIPMASIGYGVRSDLLNEIIKGSNRTTFIMSEWFIPNGFFYMYQGKYIRNEDFSKKANLGKSHAVIKAEANALFGGIPIYEDTLRLIYTDSAYASYNVHFFFENSVSACYAIYAFKPPSSSKYAEFYRPGIKEAVYDITIGTSMSYVHSKFGYGYETNYSIDSTVIYHTYSSKGISFAYERAKDYIVYAIEISEPVGLGKKRRIYDRSQTSGLPGWARP